MRTWAGTAALTIAAASAALMLVPALFGLQRYVITGSSMSGTYDRGSIVFEETVPVDQLRIGDVITYEPPRSAGVDGVLTHRIVALTHDRGGHPVLRTRGDANASRDPWRFTLKGSEQARVVAAVPYVGYAFAGLGIREVRMVLIGGPALLIAIALLAGLWREAGEDAARRRLAAVEPGGSDKP